MYIKERLGRRSCCGNVRQTNHKGRHGHVRERTWTMVAWKNQRHSTEGLEWDGTAGMLFLLFEWLNRLSTECLDSSLGRLELDRHKGLNIKNQKLRRKGLDFTQGPVERATGTGISKIQKNRMVGSSDASKQGLDGSNLSVVVQRNRSESKLEM